MRVFTTFDGVGILMGCIRACKNAADCRLCGTCFMEGKAQIKYLWAPSVRRIMSIHISFFFGGGGLSLRIVYVQQHFNLKLKIICAVA